MIGISENILLELTMAWCIISEDNAIHRGKVRLNAKLYSEYQKQGGT